MYLTRGREKLRQPFRSWRERTHDDRSTAHADRNKAITVSILMQRVGVDQANGGGRWRGIVSPPLVGRGVVVGPGRATRSLKGRRRKKKAVFHGIDETSFAMEKRSANERTNERTDGGLFISRRALSRQLVNRCLPWPPSSLSAVLLSRPLSSDHARNTRCCVLLLSLLSSSFFLMQIICPRVHHFFSSNF